VLKEINYKKCPKQDDPSVNPLTLELIVALLIIFFLSITVCFLYRKIKDHKATDAKG